MTTETTTKKSLRVTVRFIGKDQNTKEKDLFVERVSIEVPRIFSYEDAVKAAGDSLWKLGYSSIEVESLAFN